MNSIAFIIITSYPTSGPMKKLFAILALLTLTSGAQAQVQKQKESFEAFKKNIRNRYENYCNAMLNRYADFLDVVWKDFEQKRPVERFRSPKPKERPVAKEPNPVKLDRKSVV